MADRNSMIRNIYYQELGRLEPDQAGADYWATRTDLNDDQLRNAIRGAGLGPNAGASVTAPLLADQSYAAFMRRMQFDESQIQSSLQAAQEAAVRRIQGQAGIYDKQREQGAKGVDQGFESRGMYRSGGRLNALNESRMGIDVQQRQFESGVQESKAQMERDAASKISDMRRQRAEEELSARDRLTTRSAGL